MVAEGSKDSSRMLSELQENGDKAALPESPGTSGPERGRQARSKSSSRRRRSEPAPGRLTSRRLHAEKADDVPEEDYKLKVDKLVGQAALDAQYFEQLRAFVNALQRQTEGNDRNLKQYQAKLKEFHENFQQQFNERHGAITKELGDLFGRFDGVLEASVKNLVVQQNGAVQQKVEALESNFQEFVAKEHGVLQQKLEALDERVHADGRRFA